MDFELPEDTYVLEFAAGTKLAGLEVRCRPPTVDEALENIDWSWLSDPELPTEQIQKKLSEVYAMFAQRLVGWNLKRRGEPVPPTIVGIRSLPNDFVMRVIRQWIFQTSTVSSDVDAPLDADSNTGSDLVDESLIPMDTALLAHAS